MINKYRLYENGCESNWKTVTKKIDKILEKASDEIINLSHVTDIGIGDTASDEAIAQEFYNLIH